MAIEAAFVYELLANLVGAFSGFSLALIADRRYRRQRERRNERDLRERYQRARESIVGSVVKNVAAARRLARGEDAAFELEDAVWTAVRDEYIATAPTVDERVVVARFFEHVDHLQAAAHRCEILQDEGRASPEVIAAARSRLAARAKEVEVAGKWLVADFGTSYHREMVGAEDLPSVPAGDQARSDGVSIQRF